jgi:hypothetical protein
MSSSRRTTVGALSRVGEGGVLPSARKLHSVNETFALSRSNHIPSWTVRMSGSSVSTSPSFSLQWRYTGDLSCFADPGTATACACPFGGGCANSRLFCMCRGFVERKDVMVRCQGRCNGQDVRRFGQREPDRTIDDATAPEVAQRTEGVEAQSGGGSLGRRQYFFRRLVRRKPRSHSLIVDSMAAGLCAPAFLM